MPMFVYSQCYISFKLMFDALELVIMNVWLHLSCFLA